MATFTNQATLSYNGNTVNSNTVTGNIVEVLAATKTAVTGTYSRNEDVTYIISITNSGALPLTGVTVTDNLGEYEFNATTLTPLDYITDSAVYYQNGVLQNTLVVTENPLVFSGITIPAGGNVMIVYEARANSFAPLAAQNTITNTVTVSGQGIITPVTAEETITALAEPVLSIAKGLNPVNVTENSELTYTFTIQNTGNTEAATTDNVQILDTFNPILSGVSVVVNGTVITTDNYTYDETTGEFSLNPGVVTVPAAVYEQNPTTGELEITPGVTIVTVTGTI